MATLMVFLPARHALHACLAGPKVPLHFSHMLVHNECIMYNLAMQLCIT